MSELALVVRFPDDYDDRIVRAALDEASSLVSDLLYDLDANDKTIYITYHIDQVKEKP